MRARLIFGGFTMDLDKYKFIRFNRFLSRTVLFVQKATFLIFPIYSLLIFVIIGLTLEALDTLWHCTTPATEFRAFFEYAGLKTGSNAAYSGGPWSACPP